MLLMYVIPKAQKIKLAKEKNETTNYNKILLNFTDKLKHKCTSQLSTAEKFYL